MEHAATSRRQQRAKICFTLNYLFALAVCVRLDFTPEEENNKSISVGVDQMNESSQLTTAHMRQI